MPPQRAQLLSRWNRYWVLLSLGLLASAFPTVLLAHNSTPAMAAASTTAHVSITTSDMKHSPIGADALRRTARVLAQEQAALRARVRREWQAARELRQERREQAQRRADRQERRELSQWVLPVSGATWSSSFGEAGSMWSSGYHTGQDFLAPYGTPVMAAGSGTITFAGWSDAYGNKIEITHPDGNQTWYAHMSEFAQTSGTVAPGDVIGYVGCTGNCFGNHLHFEFHPGGGAAADPMAWLNSQGAF
jgi:murein DD-endopeptidase MepM/ murein hydrolase activator NlpD